MKGFKGILVLFALIVLISSVSAETQPNSIMQMITGFMSGFSSNEVVNNINDSLLEDTGPGDDGRMTGPGDDGKTKTDAMGPGDDGKTMGPGDDEKTEQVSVSNPVTTIVQKIGNIFSGIFGFFG